MSRKVTQWAVVDSLGGVQSVWDTAAEAREQLEPDERAVKLVEHDPRADAVVRAAVKAEKLRAALFTCEAGPLWEQTQRQWMSACEAESVAIERYQKGKR